MLFSSHHLLANLQQSAKPCGSRSCPTFLVAASKWSLWHASKTSPPFSFSRSTPWMSGSCRRGMVAGGGWLTKLLLCQGGPGQKCRDTQPPCLQLHNTTITTYALAALGETRLVPRMSNCSRSLQYLATVSKLLSSTRLKREYSESQTCNFIYILEFNDVV
jgi:hypothetical protein